MCTQANVCRWLQDHRRALAYLVPPEGPRLLHAQHTGGSNTSTHQETHFAPSEDTSRHTRRRGPPLFPRVCCAAAVLRIIPPCSIIVPAGTVNYTRYCRTLLLLD
jgi:hypothetical protein